MPRIWRLGMEAQPRWRTSARMANSSPGSDSSSPSTLMWAASMRVRSTSSRKASSTWPEDVSVRPMLTPTFRPKDQRSGLSTWAMTTTRPPWYTARWQDWRAAGQLAQQRQRHADQRFQRLLAVRQLEHLQGEGVAVVFVDLHVAPALQRHGHAEDLADAAVDPMRQLGQRVGRAGGQRFQDVQPFSSAGASAVRRRPRRARRRTRNRAGRARSVSWRAWRAGGSGREASIGDCLAAIRPLSATRRGFSATARPGPRCPGA